MDSEETNDSVNGNNGNESPEILSQRAYQKTPSRLRVLLDVYGKTGRLVHACEVAGVAHNTHYRKMKTDAAWRAAFEKAESLAGQYLEDLAYQRAVDGDNQMLHILLKRFKPEQYRERITADISITVNLGERMRAADQRLIALRHEPATNAA